MAVYWYEMPEHLLVMKPKNAAALPAAQVRATTQLPPADFLGELCVSLQNCQKCKLSKGRKHVVFGEGSKTARLMIVGEGPGEQEDLQGRPFVGKAGQLLDRMIAAIGLKRDEVYICNVIKCRPPGNRNPELDEIQACSPFLQQQIEAIQPEFILALGKFAAQNLLKSETPISRLRGHVYSFGNAKLLASFHPSYLLRNPPAKKDAWEDLQKLAQEMKLTLPPRVGH